MQHDGLKQAGTQTKKQGSKNKQASKRGSKQPMQASKEASRRGNKQGFEACKQT
jgi:hypothetical protein